MVRCVKNEGPKIQLDLHTVFFVRVFSTQAQPRAQDFKIPGLKGGILALFAQLSNLKASGETHVAALVQMGWWQHYNQRL